MGSNYFEVFNLSPRFQLDLDELKSRYYKLSLQYHPDRVGIQDAVQMTAINEALRTLGDASSRRHYLLKLQGLESKDQSKGRMLELAARWFDVQDEGAQARGAFLRDIHGTQKKVENDLSELEKRADASGFGSGEFLEHSKKILSLMLDLNTLEALERDVIKAKDDGHSN